MQHKTFIWIAIIFLCFAFSAVAQEWSGPKFDARLGDPYSQGWQPRDCKHVQFDDQGNIIENGADLVQAFGCYDGAPFLSPEFMSLKKETGIDVLHVDYRVYELPTWQSLTSCADVTTYNSQLKEECRAHHNYRQAFQAGMQDADDEWEGFTVVWMARREMLPGCIGMRVKAFAGVPSDHVQTGDRVLSGFEARYGCVDPDNDIFGPDNLVVRADPDPATGHDYVTPFPEDDGSDNWHIYRIAVEVADTSTNSMCKIYLDENSEPIIVTAHAKPERDTSDPMSNHVYFGVGGWNCPKVASMAWLLTSVDGAYGPDELPIPQEYSDIYATARSYQDGTLAHPEDWEGPMYDARYGDPYCQGWNPRDCKHAQLDLSTGLWLENGADSVAAFGCYYTGYPTLSPEYMSIIEEDGIASLHVDYRVFTLPTWQSLTSCAEVTTYNSQMKEECRAHHNYRQAFQSGMQDADDEWEGFTVVWCARAEWLPGSIGMRVKAYAGVPSDHVQTGERLLSGFEVRYGCVDADDDIFGPDNFVIRADPDPATGHDYVTPFPEDNGSDHWHIYRIAVEVADTSTNSMCKVYLDENPEPIIVTAHAKPERDNQDPMGNHVYFGVGGWNCPKVASMAWVLTTTEGAYGPDEVPVPDEYMQIFTTARDNYIAAVEPLINQESALVPDGYSLEQNYPNPFNPVTMLRYKIKQAERVTLTIFNTQGQLLTSLVNKNQNPGTYSVKWDGKDLYGTAMASGTYFALLKTPSYSQTIKMVLIK
ncbi:T9SS type A sorting domain-containing protein [candidate division KSB1 bacterium]|nr:T9SS type A sorting domain-containing protein [candidate division KSB1 bacterium]